MIVGNLIKARPLEKQDLWQIWQWHELAQIQYLNKLFPFLTYDKLVKDNKVISTWKKDFVFELLNGTLIGVFSYWSLSWKNRTCQFGYFINPEISDAEIKSEVINLIKYFLLGYKNLLKIYSFLPENSIQLENYEKNGFIKEGELRKSLFINGNYLNEIIFSIDANYYTKQKR